MVILSADVAGIGERAFPAPLKATAAGVDAVHR
jgi:hypothetical protein